MGAQISLVHGASPPSALTPDLQMRPAVPLPLLQSTRRYAQACPWMPPGWPATQGWRGWPALPGGWPCQYTKRLHVNVPFSSLNRAWRALLCRIAGLQINLPATAGGQWQAIPLPELVQQLNSCAAAAALCSGRSSSN